MNKCMVFDLPKISFSHFLPRMQNCKLTEEGCDALVSGLRSNASHLRELNLGNNEIGDSEMKLLSNFLEDPYCKLEKLQ